LLFNQYSGALHLEYLNDSGQLQIFRCSAPEIQFGGALAYQYSGALHLEYLNDSGQLPIFRCSAPEIQFGGALAYKYSGALHLEYRIDRIIPAARLNILPGSPATA